MYIEEQKAVHAARASSESEIGEVGSEMGSVMGMTQARDADEFSPAEGINLPIVYNLHSNYSVMRHAVDQEISSMGFQKLL